MRPVRRSSKDTGRLNAVRGKTARHLRLGVEMTQNIVTRMSAGTYEEMLDVIDDEFPDVFEFLADPRPNPPTLSPELRTMFEGRQQRDIIKTEVRAGRGWRCPGLTD